jgi:hypothetical protein
VARADDTPQAVQGRRRDHHEKTRPVLELFWAKEVIVAVDATGPVAKVQAAMREQLEYDTSAYRLLPMAAARPRPWAVASHPKVTTC